MEEPAVKQAMLAAETSLGTAGRLLVRKSGTEPLIRVMAEGEDEALVHRVLDDLCGTIEQAVS